MKKLLSNRIFLIGSGGVLVLFVICCVGIFVLSKTPSSKATFTVEAMVKSTEAARPTKTLAPSDTPEPSVTPLPTNTPEPTNTPAPTNTPEPTNTPKPTNTPTPAPQPITLTGQGDSVVDLDKWDGPAIVKIKYTGGGNFAVINHDPNGEYMDLLVNTIGSYQGTVPLDFYDIEHTDRFEVKASGNWEIVVYPFDPEYLRFETIPGTFEGTGDDVVGLKGGSPDLLKAEATGDSNFAVWSISDDGKDLLINEIAPYSGTVMINQTSVLIIIKASGPWKIEITTK